MNEIEEFGQRIGKEFGAEKVILFNSYAQGTAEGGVFRKVVCRFWIV